MELFLIFLVWRFNTISDFALILFYLMLTKINAITVAVLTLSSFLDTEQAKAHEGITIPVKKTKIEGKENSNHPMNPMRFQAMKKRQRLHQQGPLSFYL